ncbi:beta strand repeat-containing protein [Thiorhodovibrio frisius]|uniref:Uncharacterized protein n=1 Tax=Thiorhodovibrio frisius TaxID=631362 RepID=H8Z1T9_9GAMM|nr:hypothetical protein [Thiorhodovibrio frisius]EIC22567.1 hypothetical protein Thi970DRAFT_02838 [Thiorhodovibrio frisius]WPL20008.1 Paracrystalline surface layer protein [Thiorhodovibrio frisius]
MANFIMNENGVPTEDPINIGADQSFTFYGSTAGFTVNIAAGGVAMGLDAGVAEINLNGLASTDVTMKQNGTTLLILDGEGNTIVSVAGGTGKTTIINFDNGTTFLEVGTNAEGNQGLDIGGTSLPSDGTSLAGNDIPTPGAPISLETALEQQAAGTLASPYYISSGTTYDAGSVSVADAGATYGDVETVLAGAANSAKLSIDSLFVWSIEDTGTNIAAAIDEPTVTGAKGVTLSAAATVEQATAITALENFEGTYKLADTGANILAAETTVLEGAESFALTDPAGTVFSVTPDEQTTLEQATNASDYKIGVAGGDFDLTTGMDWVGPSAPADPDAYNQVSLSSADNDTINGVSSFVSTEKTLNADDQIDGGAGDDTLNVELKGSFDGFSEEGFLKNVETVKLTNAGGSGINFAAKGVEGVTNYIVDGSVNLSDIGTLGSNVSYTDVASGTLTIGYATDVTKGTNDTQDIQVSNVGTVESTGVAEQAVTINADGIENLNINAMGDNVVALGKDSAKSVVVDGGSSLKMTDVGTGLTSFDGTNMSGPLDIDFSEATGVKTVNGGSGDDTFRAKQGDFAADVTINGQGGDDTLVFDGSIGTVQFQMSGVESVQFGGTGNAKSTFSAKTTTGLQQVVMQDGTNLEVDVATLGATGMELNLQKDAGGKVSLDNAGTTTLNVTGGTSETETVATTNVTLTKSASVDMTVDQYSGFEGDLKANEAQAVTVSAAGDTKFTGDSVFTKAQSLTVDAAGTFDASAAEFGAMANLTLAGLGGSAKLGDIGKESLGYGIGASVSGLSEGVVIGSIKTGDDQDVTLNLNGAQGDVLVGMDTAAAQPTPDPADSVITGKAVTVNAAGALGTVDIVKYLGNPGVQANQSVRTDAIDAETVTFTGSELFANSVGAKVTKAATMTGGNEDDVFVMTSAAAEDSTVTISLTGGLGNDLFLGGDDATDPAGKTKITITDFNQGDQTNQSLATKVVNYTNAETEGTPQGADEAAAFLVSAGVSGATASNIELVDAEVNGNSIDAILYNGNTYFALNDGSGTTGTDDNSFDNGDTLVTLTGVSLTADQIEGDGANIPAFFGYVDPDPVAAA